MSVAAEARLQSTGAEMLARSARAAGVDVVFANPGTTEVHLVHALTNTEGIRNILCLFEGVCAGAADGYGRVTGRPAMTLLHLGPGLANALANLHNARRARTPLINVVGEQARAHLAADSPITSDIAGLAKAMSLWVRTNGAPEEMSWDFAAVVSAALRGTVATLIVPADCQWAPIDEPVVRPTRPVYGFYSARIDQGARMLADGARSALLIGGRLDADGLAAANRVSAATGCRLFVERTPSIQRSGRGIPMPERLEYFPERAADQLKSIETLVLAGATLPVPYFAVPERSGHVLPASTEVLTLVEPHEDVCGALEGLSDALRAPPVDASTYPRVAPPSGPLTPESVARALAATQPQDAIVVDEAVTTGFVYRQLLDRCAPHDWIPLTGGAIGQGLPVATGAAVAAPNRPVIAFVGDGSAMYTIQALWTQAHLGLNVTTIICSNRRYAIVADEYTRAGFRSPPPSVADLLDIREPALRWSDLARSFGVPAVAVESSEQLQDALARAFSEPGPQLIEAQLAT